MASTDDDLALIRSHVADLCSGFDDDYWAAYDREHRFPWDFYTAMAEGGWIGIAIPEEYGGTHTEEGCGTLTLNIAVEEISKACASTALTLMVAELGTLPVRIGGNDEQKKQWLPKVASGEWSPAFALSEPEAGSDVKSMRTTAVVDGDEYVINGSKSWISNAGIADWYVVFAVTDKEAGHKGISAFVVPADAAGFSIDKLEHKMGIKGSPTGGLSFSDVRIPLDYRLGEEGEGFKIAMQTLDRSRLGVAAQGLGIAQGALDFAAAYAKERQAFGQAIINYQAVSAKLADAAIGCAAGRELLYKAACGVDRNEPGFGAVSSMAKVFNADHAMKTTIDMVQILGGYGYVKEYPMERMMRDAKITQIYEGAQEIQRVVVARSL